MRKLACMLVLGCLLAAVVPAWSITPQNELTTVRKHIHELEVNLSRARNPRVRADLERQIRNEKAREQRLQNQVAPVVPVQPIVTPVAPVEQPVTPVPPRATLKPPKAREPGVEVGVLGGYVAGTLGMGGELRLNRPFDLVGMVLRLTGIYATDNKDAGGALRKNGIVGLDLIYRLTPAATPGIRSYMGLGANYIVDTSGQTQGAIGGQAFYGIEGNLGFGDLFLEAGYGMIRPRISDDRSGLNLLLGYKLGF